MTFMTTNQHTLQVVAINVEIAAKALSNDIITVLHKEETLHYIMRFLFHFVCGKGRNNYGRVGLRLDRDSSL